MNKEQKLEKHKSLSKWGVNNWFNYPGLYDRTTTIAVEGDFCEIGCWCGISSAYLMIQNPDRKVICVDHFKGNELNQGEQTTIKKNNLVLEDEFDSNMSALELTPTKLVGDTSEMVHQIPDKSLAFLFVDAGHLYDEVKRDIENYLPKMKEGGVIAFHDYDSPGVRKAVDETFDKVEPMGPSSAWVQL